MIPLFDYSEPQNSESRESISVFEILNQY